VTVDRISARAKALWSVLFTALLACAATGFIGSGSARAASFNYCGQVVSSFSQCPDRSIVVGNATRNAAGYPGAGNVSVCQRIERPSDQALRNRTCAINYTQSPTANYGTSQGLVGNNDNDNHTVNGTIFYSDAAAAASQRQLFGDFGRQAAAGFWQPAVRPDDGGFAVWNRPMDADDMPSDAVLGEEAIERGADHGQSRRLRNVLGKEVYATAVRGGVCLSSADYTVSSCRPAAALSNLGRGGANALVGLEAETCSPFLTPDKVAIYGLVADGVSEVTLARSDGTSVSVAVQDNFLLVVMDRHTSLVEQIGRAHV